MGIREVDPNASRPSPFPTVLQHEQVHRPPTSQSRLRGLLSADRLGISLKFEQGSTLSTLARVSRFMTAQPPCIWSTHPILAFSAPAGVASRWLSLLWFPDSPSFKLFRSFTARSSVRDFAICGFSRLPWLRRKSNAQPFVVFEALALTSIQRRPFGVLCLRPRSFVPLDI